MKKFYSLLIVLTFTLQLFSQTGTEFWFAPPNITDSHLPAEINDVYLNITCLDQDAVVHIWQPANLTGVDMTIPFLANTSQKIYLGANIADLETKPLDAVLNTGLLIESTEKISAYYEYDNTNNPDIFALKGANALGTEFYIPLQNHQNYSNSLRVDPAYASFDIVATEDGTTVRIYPTREIDGHVGLQQYTITLDKGQTYSGGWTGVNYRQTSTHPYGTVITSDKPIAVSIKDDSVYGLTTGGQNDLLGDQIVPVSVIGNDYIVVKGQLNNDREESCFILATQNATEIYINGAALPEATLFAGEMYKYTLPIGQNYTYVQSTAPVYVTHVTGFVGEMGEAILPPLNCAGSEEVSFVRSTGPPLNPLEEFFLTLLVKTPSIGDFTIITETTTANAQAAIDAAVWTLVPGTGGEWMGTTIQFDETEIAVGEACRLSNSSDVFAMGLINGGGSSGCRYGYFSEFVSEIFADAGIDQTICANATATLNGSVTGGATTGIWTTSGSGSFDDDTDFNAEYTPSFADATAGSVTLTLSSTGLCFPTSDDMVLSFDPAPTVDAGIDETVCENNVDVAVNGTITVATGGIWSTVGDGTFAVPTALNTTYTPGAADITAGNVKLYLTTTGNGSCNEEKDSLIVTITPAPTINAGADQTVCANNADVTLSASVTVATGGQWSGGTGSYNPGSSALNTIYTPSAPEIANGSVTLTVTSTGNGTCIAVSDDIIINFSAIPVVDAGPNQVKCSNNEATVLSGSISGGASAGIWSNGLGTFFVDNTDLNASYTPTATEIANGSVTLTLTTTDHGANACSAESDQMTISFTPAPTVNAGVDQTVCENNADVAISGTITVATGGIWSTAGDGAFAAPTALNTTYTPGAADITTGSVQIYLTTTGNGSCVEEKDSLIVTITPSPTINAGLDQTVCANNADATLGAIVTVATGGQWSGGAGSYNPGSSALNTIYSPSAPEIASGSVTLTVTSTGNGTCLAVSDDIIVNFSSSPLVDAGPDQIKCSNNEITVLSGSISGGASAGIWSNGLGTFFVDNTQLNATYTATATEIANGSVTLTLTTTDHGANACSAESDQMTISFTPAPTVNAGIDQTVCANNVDVSLNGTVTVATGGIWSTVGDGTFAVPTALNTTYTPGATDITTGSVKLYLTTTGNGSCNEEKDSLIVTITPSPTINAGLDQTVCANNADITLNGAVTVATAWQWTGGAGAYNPGNTAINTIYSPTIAEIASGSIMLTLTTTAQGTCNPVSDDISITFSPAPVVDAGPDQVKCSNNEVTVLSGSISGGASTGIWSNGLGTFFVDNTQLNVTYTPTATEIANGSVTLTLTTTDHGANACSAESDQMTILFTPAPTVNAGVDQTVCANNVDVSLNGTVTVAAGGIWSTVGDGTLAVPTALNTTYTPGATDITTGSVKLYLTTTGNGSCNEEKDSLIVTITPSPTINAGLDQTICANNTDITLNGAVTVATAWQWTGGTGAYNPGNTAINTIYSPTAAEIASGSIILTLTTTVQGTCNPVSDDISITFSPAPVVDAGPDQVKCSNNEITVLSGSISGGASAGIWTNGLGTFFVDNTQLNASYTPTATEIVNGSVTLTLITSNHAINGCSQESDQMTISFTPAPTVNAGVDQTVCANNVDVSLNGTVTVAAGGIWSTVGDGSFAVPTALNTTYTPGATDITTGSVKLYLTTTGNGSCNEEKDSLIVTITPSPTINAGLDQTICANNTDITLNGTVTVATAWQWTGGTGAYNPGNTAINTIYSPTIAEIASGSIMLTLITTAQGTCNPVSDDISITFSPAPVVDAGPDQIKCSNNEVTTLSGSISGGASAGTWTNGLGTFFVDNNDLNADYTPTATEIANGSVTLTLTSSDHASNGCSAVGDQMTISFTAAPTADAGIDIDVCQNNPDATLSGIVTIASGGTWSGGAGTFAPNANDLNAVYTPSAAEALAGNPITLTLTTTGNGTCTSVSDQVVINFDPSPIVNAGSDLTSCENNPQVTLQGSVVNAGGGMWTGSAGSFSPSNTDLLATFTPTAFDISNGSVSLTLTSINNGNCNSESDIMVLTIVPSPIVDAGSDATYCANNATISLNGSVSNATGGVWSGGLGIFGDPNSLNTTYQPNATEIANGSLDIFLTSTGNGSCNSVQDVVTFTFTTAPTADAGIDQTVCANNPDIYLSGSVTIATGGTWSGGLGTFTPNANDLNATYTPSAAEILAQSVSLTLTTTGNGTCVSVSDVIDIVINASPIVSAGADIHSCQNNPSVTLNGNVTNATGGIWSGGSGVFNPNNTILNADYTPTAGEISSGQVMLYLTSTGNGSCVAVLDSMLIIIDPAPTVNAGIDQTVCANNADVVLNGSITLASGGVWSGGLGTFIPNNSILNATYSPTAAEIASGSVDLILTSTGNGFCLAVDDQVTINYTVAPIVDAGLDFEVCANNSQIDLSGIVTIASGGIWSGGTGTYSPSNVSIITSYFPTPTEITNGSIILTLTSTGNGNCIAESDDIEITINFSPIVSAGVDQSVCVDDMNANLNGSVSGITNTGVWSTSGSGFFVPNNTALNATYVCSSADSIFGSVELTLTSTNNGVCLSENDFLTVTILTAGAADAGIDQTVCANNSAVALNGIVSGGATTGTWSSSGSGVFVPTNTALNATYIPSVFDTLIGSVTLNSYSK